MRTVGAATDLTRQMLASDASVAVARRLVSGTLDLWGLPHAANDARQITSELVTNAVRVSPPAAVIQLRLARRAEGVSLAVWDQSDELPEPETVMLDLETLDALPDDAGPATLPPFGGWGLPIAAAPSLKTWSEVTPPQGKWVCVQLKI